ATFLSSLNRRAPPAFPTRRSSDLERLRLHGEALLAGARQELRDVARQPHVATTRPPSAECARGILHLEDACDRIFDPLSELVVRDRKSTRLNSSHVKTSYAVFCLK